ncbi:unnamed protein product [Polarella glacialis]|uniref:Uncharacterized protein n=1 Tax=Polarella glacialis TaxID=89957 RepID=A0A813JPV6_POLGL|nr:unnamed protein product [Polarella glacialis]
MSMLRPLNRTAMLLLLFRCCCCCCCCCYSCGCCCCCCCLLLFVVVVVVVVVVVCCCFCCGGICGILFRRKPSANDRNQDNHKYDRYNEVGTPISCSGSRQNQGLLPNILIWDCHSDDTTWGILGDETANQEFDAKELVGRWVLLGKIIQLLTTPGHSFVPVAAVSVVAVRRLGRFTPGLTTLVEPSEVQESTTTTKTRMIMKSFCKEPGIG